MKTWTDLPQSDTGEIPLWRKCSERLYRLAVRAHQKTSATPTTVPGARVLSVGNLEVGGTGKTPCVLWWAAKLQLHGRTAVVTRPYGGDLEGAASDEIALFQERLPSGVELEYATRKLDAALRAAARGAEFIVVDDGFSHRILARDLDLVLVDARRPFANGHVIPAGRLREPPDSISRAGAVVMTRADRADSTKLERSKEEIRRAGFVGPILMAGHRYAGLKHLGNAVPDEGRRFLCLSALGRPGELGEAARCAGLDVAGEVSYPDHHRFSDEEWTHVTAICTLPRTVCWTTSGP